jgi:hypothetical protein
VPSFVVDTAKSRARIRTFAQGLLARLAHDLELTCHGLTGKGDQTAAESGTASLEIPIAKIEVAGTLKGERVDPNGLSPSDRADCLEKMVRDVFHTRASDGDVVRVEASLEAHGARVRITPPRGRAVERTVALRIAREGEGTRVTGRFDLSLEALGSDPVKGPMNAFRVKDQVEVLFDVVFAPKV